MKAGSIERMKGSRNSKSDAGRTPSGRPGDSGKTARGFREPARSRSTGAARHQQKLNPDGRRRSDDTPLPGTAVSDRGQRSDEQLIAAYRGGDRDSFSQLMERYQRELFHFLVRFLGDRAAAEDIFQETFLQIHQSAQNFDTERRFRPWLFTIAANKARDLIRATARRPVNPLQASINPGDGGGGEFIDLMQSADPMPDEPMEQAELRQKVRGTVMTMPNHLREILLLSYFHQFPYKQISDMLDIPLGTVKSRLHAAVAHFSDRWQSTNHNPFMS